MRNWILLLLGLAIIMLLAIYVLRSYAPQQEGLELPLNLANIIPEAWQPLDKKLPTVDIDGDGELEWLLIYRYDSAREGRGPIGGVIYDAQVDISPHQLGVPIPYRSAFLVPYKLLPDTHPGKGQGYLADHRVDPPEQVDSNGNGKVDELVIRGYGHDPAMTRLSIFRWEGKEEGYSVQHFQGSGGITAVDSDKDGVIEKVIVSERLYERSQLCRQRTHTRQSDGSYQPSDSSLVFCYGTPAHPFYPEGVVLTFFLSSQQERQTEVMKPADEPGLMTPNGRRQARDLGLHQVRSFRVLQFTYPGVAPPSGEPATAVNEELQGREQVQVWTDVVGDGEPRTYCWRVVNTSSQKVSEDTVWRIDGVCRG